MPALTPDHGRRAPKKKADRNAALSDRALADLDAWIADGPQASAPDEDVLAADAARP